MKKILEFFVDQGMFVNLLSVLILIAGGLTIIQMPREVFPNVSFDIVLVKAVYPGASALEVENLVTNVIEESLREVDGIKEIWGNSVESMSVTSLILDPDVKDKKKVVDDIRTAVDNIIDLPEDVDPPLVEEVESKNQPIIEVALNGEVPYSVLRENAKWMAKRLEKIPGVARVDKRGYYGAEIWIEADSALLDKFHVSLAEINKVVLENNVSIPGGILKGEGGHDIIVRTLDQIHTAENVKNIIIRKSYNGDIVRISDVATVKNAFDDPKTLFRTNLKRGINLQVVKKENKDAINMVEKVREVATAHRSKLTQGVDFEFVNDYSFFVSRRLKIIMNNGLLGVILVLIILFLFLSPWVAIWTAVAIPVALCIAFYFIGPAGVTINLISLLGFLVVLGILVDDSIVVGENIFRHMENGVDPQTAAKRGLLEVARPVSATIVTTIAAFAPLMFMPGIMGKFIWAIPVVIILSLIGSWMESFLILPNHMSDLIPKRSLEKIKERGRLMGPSEKQKHFIMSPIRNLYLKYLSKAIRYRYGVIALFVAVLIGCGILVKTGVIPFILFESRGIEMFYVKVEGPTSASLEKTEAELIRVEKLIFDELREEEIDFISTIVGQTTQGHNDPYQVTSSHVGQVQVKVTHESDRERSFEEIFEAIRDSIDAAPKTDFKIIHDRLKPGPPVGKPISAQIKGDNLEELKRLGDQMAQDVKTVPGITDVVHTLIPGKEEWIVKIDKIKAGDLNVSIPLVAQTIQTAFDGFVSTSIRTVDEEIEIRTRLRESQRIPDKNLIKNLTVPNATGQLIPLERLVSIESKTGYISVAHSEWERYVMIGGQIDEDVTTAVKANQVLMEKFKNFDNEHPGYTLEFKGEFEETQESLLDLLRMFIIAFGIIFLIIATTFRSLLQPFIIMACVPFSFIGVCIAFWIQGYPLGFLAMIGIIGLVGVVVNDSIIFTEFINASMRRGKQLIPSIVEAGRRRIRPILLTSLTTVFGLLPTAYGIGGYDPFLVPLCMAIAWGLAFGTFVTLFLLPSFYAAADDLRRLLGIPIGKAKDFIEQNNV